MQLFVFKAEDTMTIIHLHVISCDVTLVKAEESPSERKINPKL